MEFKLVSNFAPTGDQPAAIENLVDGILKNKKHQVLLGATGTGKTFTISNVIAKLQRPALVLVHNKTLAGQLYLEFKEFFPENRVEYFVSNFDFYQPEAYLAHSDTYIEKTAMMNTEIEMMRSSAVQAVLERRDTIIVASVASIYALSNPLEYKSLAFTISFNEQITIKELSGKLVTCQYVRNNMENSVGTFKVKGDVIEIVPGFTDKFSIRVEFFGDIIEKISEIDPLTGKVLNSYSSYTFFPATERATLKTKVLEACTVIEKEMHERVAEFKQQGKLLEAERLEQRTRFDLESMREFGRCNGIENYSRHIEKRSVGETPFNLFDYFPNDYLLIVDESHVSLPQVRGMYNGDRARKESLVEYGFRLPSALDNRPMKFEEFEERINQAIYVSATPGDYELNKVDYEVVQQIIRPTGLLDPLIEVRPSYGQIDDIISEIKARIKVNERTIITTLTIKMSEDLTEYLRMQGLSVIYLHSETKTLERSQILYELRKGKYDVLVGINLLREGLDLPEVSLVAIIDADKEGFLRSRRSLIQTAGRAARNSNGKVIMYGDKITDSMQETINETLRRRAIQETYNQKHNITPLTIIKEIRAPITLKVSDTGETKKKKSLSDKELKLEISRLEKEMKKAASDLDFEQAAMIRDMILELKVNSKV